MSTVAGNSLQYTAEQNGICVMAPAKRAFYANGTSVSDVAVFAKPSTPSTSDLGTAGVLDGTYSYIVTFVDSNAGNDFTESEGSSASTPLAVSTSQIRVTIPSSPPSRATHWRIYRNTPGGNIYYQLTELAVGTTTYDDNNADADIVDLQQYETDHDPMPDLTGIRSHNSLVFGWNSNRIYWTKTTASTDEIGLNPEYWPLLNVNTLMDGEGGEIQGVSAVGDALAIYMDSSLHLLTYQDDPFANGTFQLVQIGRGSLNGKCVVDVSGVPFALDQYGVHEYRGSREVIGIGGIEDYVRRMNLDAASTFWGAYADGRLYFAVALDSDARPHDMLVLDVESYRQDGVPRWWRRHYDHPLYPGGFARTGSDAGEAPARTNVLCFSDDKSQVYLDDWLLADGVPATCVAEYTVLSQTNPSSNTQFTCAKLRSNDPGSDFDTATYNLSGLYLRTNDSRYPGPYRIASVSGLTVTIDEEITDSLVDAEIWVGGIHQIYETTEFDYDAPSKMKRVGPMEVRFEPAPWPFDYTLGVAFNKDRKGYIPAGVTLDGFGADPTSGDEKIALRVAGDYDEGARGFAHVPCGNRPFAVMQVKLEDDRPLRPVSVLGMAAPPIEAKETR